MALAATAETMTMGRRKAREGQDPERRCLASGQVRPKRELIRFVVAPDGRVMPDLKGELPGRGLWVAAERDALRKACAPGRFAKAARRDVAVPDDLIERVELGLRRRCLDLLGLARRAGGVAAGFEQVQALLRSDKAGALLQAADGSAQGRDKISALARAVRPGLAEIDLFSAEELGQALGRDGVVHVALEPGAIADRLVQEAGRLRGVAAGGGAPSMNRTVA